MKIPNPSVRCGDWKKQILMEKLERRTLGKRSGCHLSKMSVEYSENASFRVPKQDFQTSGMD